MVTFPPTITVPLEPLVAEKDVLFPVRATMVVPASSGSLMIHEPPKDCSFTWSTTSAGPLMATAAAVRFGEVDTFTWALGASRRKSTGPLLVRDRKSVV